ncbi:IclR family transcriptional regulator [Pseudonocardia sulfidoxydans]|nr:IclR family transcriptional regulator [Pseudonocardia sulfidoxydans]
MHVLSTGGDPPQDPGATDAGSRSGLARALAVIGTLSERAPEAMGVSAISRELGLSKTVAHRILKELVALDFLAFDEVTKGYRLGTGALQVGMAALRGLDVPRIARPHLQRLVQETGETATLSARQGAARVYIDQVLSPHEIRMSVALGTAHALHAGSSSKAILAALSDTEVEEYLEAHALAAVTGNTITSADALRADLRAIRECGYAASRGERQHGAGSVAAAVLLADGGVFGAVSLCGPVDRFGPDVAADYGTRVVAAAHKISLELGWQPDGVVDAL